MYCRLCSTWYLPRDDGEHVQRCREERFPQKARPLTRDDFKLTVRMPNASFALNNDFMIPLDNRGDVFLDKWKRQILGLLADKTIPDERGKKTEWWLIRKRQYTCVVLACRRCCRRCHCC